MTTYYQNTALGTGNAAARSITMPAQSSCVHAFVTIPPTQAKQTGSSTKMKTKENTQEKCAVVAKAIPGSVVLNISINGTEQVDNGTLFDV